MKSKKQTMNVIICAMAVSLLVGCAAKEIPPRYFVATATIEREPVEPVDSEAKKVVPWAGSLLKNGKATVAFIPPTWCMQTATGEDKYAERDIKACLALTASIEKRAAEDGFRIVDWRRLQADPHGLAKNEQIDVLFLLDEVDIHSPSMDRFRVADVSFSEQTTARERAPLELNNPSSVVARCKGAQRARQRRNMDLGHMTGATVSVKMVSVNDGTAQWFYRHTVQNDNDAAQKRVDYYYLSEGKKVTKHDKTAWGLGVTGVGIAALAGGAWMNQNGTSFAQRNIGFGLAWASILPLAIGTTMTIVGITAGARKPVYESPEKVLCSRPPMMNNPFGVETAFETDTAGENADDLYGPPDDIGSADVEKPPIIDTLANHLLSEVRNLSQDRTQPPPTLLPATSPIPTPAYSDGASSPPATAPISQPQPAHADQPTSTPAPSQGNGGNSRFIVIEKKPNQHDTTPMSGGR